jgi:hypothetical protein
MCDLFLTQCDVSKQIHFFWSHINPTYLFLQCVSVFQSLQDMYYNGNFYIVNIKIFFIPVLSFFLYHSPSNFVFQKSRPFIVFRQGEHFVCSCDDTRRVYIENVPHCSTQGTVNKCINNRKNIEWKSGKMEKHKRTKYLHISILIYVIQNIRVNWIKEAVKVVEKR